MMCISQYLNYDEQPCAQEEQYDVIVISPLGALHAIFHDKILKERPQFRNRGSLTYFVWAPISYLFEVIRLFIFVFLL